MQVDDCVLSAVDTCALCGVVDDIDEIGVIGLFDGGRNGEATHTKEAEVCGHHGGTDGTVGGFGVGFDVDDCFHCDRSYRTDGTETPPACGHPLTEGEESGHPFGVGIGGSMVSL